MPSIWPILVLAAILVADIILYFQLGHADQGYFLQVRGAAYLVPVAGLAVLALFRCILNMLLARK